MLLTTKENTTVLNVTMATLGGTENVLNVLKQSLAAKYVISMAHAEDAKKAPFFHMTELNVKYNSKTAEINLLLNMF